MKNWQDMIWQTLFGLIVVFIGGGLVGGAVTFVATMNPKTAGLIFCPAGNSASVTPEDPHYGLDQEVPVLCTDKNGVTLSSIPDDQIVARQRKYIYGPSYALVTFIVVGWLNRATIFKLLKGRDGTQVPR